MDLCNDGREKYSRRAHRAGATAAASIICTAKHNIAPFIRHRRDPGSLIYPAARLRAARYPRRPITSLADRFIAFRGFARVRPTGRHDLQCRSRYQLRIAIASRLSRR